MNRVIQPSAEAPIVDDRGCQSQVMRTFLLSLANRSVIIGTGSPEGVIEASQGALYMDDSGTSGSILYVKRDDNISGDRSQGWILV
jgi:hypothetical protein